MTINSFHGRYRFLSNYHSSPICYEGQTYPTLEAAFQAAKTTDLSLRRQIAEAPHPAEARRLGRRLVLRPYWNSMRIEVMRELLAAKFSDPELARQLMATGDDTLVEGNTWGDTFWGVCRGQGRNMLGLLLMDLRSVLATSPMFERRPCESAHH